jgi:hypothetical protein
MAGRSHCWLALLVLAGLLAVAAGPAATAPRFTVRVRSTFLRDAPDAEAARTYSVFKGQSYGVLSRTTDSAWLRLDWPAATRGTWIPAAYGRLTGEVRLVPVAEGGQAADSTATSAPASPGATPAPVDSGVTVPEQVFLTKVDGVYVLDAPRATAQRISRLGRDQAVTAVGRDASGAWLAVMFSGRGWVPANTGVLQYGISTVPLAAENTLEARGAARLAPPGPLPAWVPSISARMRRLYQRAARNGRSPRMFAAIGDCNSLHNIYLEPIATGALDLSSQPYLNSTLDTFRPAFFRGSLAVNGGYNSASILDPLWANPRECARGESPYACELRVSMASVAFILLGTGDNHSWRSFEANYRALLQYALNLGVVPVAVTKADALETIEGGAPPSYINDVIRRLAGEYGVPLLDFDLATSTLDNHGLLDEGNSDFHLSAEAIYLHNLGTLQTLYAITSGG